MQAAGWSIKNIQKNRSADEIWKFPKIWDKVHHMARDYNETRNSSIQWKKAFIHVPHLSPLLFTQPMYMNTNQQNLYKQNMFYTNPWKNFSILKTESKLMQTYHYEMETEKKKKKEIKVMISWDVTMC